MASLIHGLARDEIGKNQWVDMCAELGIEQRTLAGGSAREPGSNVIELPFVTTHAAGEGLPRPERTLPPEDANATEFRRFPIYQVTVEEAGGSAQFITFLPPDDTYRIGGLPPETVVGRLLTTGAELSGTNFVRNVSFVEFMHGVIARVVPDIEEYVEAARRQQTGALHVHDARAYETNRDVAARDIIGSFRVEDGKIVPDSYARNPEHRIVSEYGMFTPHPEIQDRLLAALRELRFDPAADE